MVKACSKCGAEKPVDEFSKDGKRKRAECKACRRAAHAAWRSTPGGQEWIRRWRRAARDKDPEAFRAKARAKYHANKPAYIERQKAVMKTPIGKARRVVHYAMLKGYIVKPDACSACGEKKPVHQIHAHHKDYSRALEITWLCSVCHGKEHRTT